MWAPCPGVPRVTVTPSTGRSRCCLSKVQLTAERGPSACFIQAMGTVIQNATGTRLTIVSDSVAMGLETHLTAPEQHSAAVHSHFLCL